MNEVVKYHNDINTVPLGRLKLSELNLFFAVCSKLKNQQKDKVILTFQEIREMSHFSATSNSVLTNTMQDMFFKIGNLYIKQENGSKQAYFHLFRGFIFDTEEENVEIQLDGEFSYLLNDLTSNFTRFELAEFITLDSVYAKNLYRLLKQFRETGIYRVKLEDFRAMMGIPNSYRQSHINKMIDNAFEELEPYFKDLEVRKIKRGRGGKVVALEFTFKSTKEVSKILSHDWLN